MTQPAQGRMGYTVREVAVALGISEAAVYKMVARGRLSTMQIGGRKFIPASVFRVLTTGQSPGVHTMTGAAND
jgi:excisionase family DNA binding protein